MKMKKKQVLATLGALGLTAGVLAGCGQDDDEYVKVVDSEGNTVFIEEDEYESNSGMFILYTAWNGNNHSKLKSSKSYSGKTYSSKPSASSKGSGVGKSSSGRSSGFGG